MNTQRSAIEIFEKRRADFAAITTFGFDPVYFERRLLRTKALERASRILVLMDAAEWGKLLQRGEPARHLNNRYLVVPVSMGSGVFHPKLVLLLGEGGITVACNSANVTRAGYSHNLELLNIGDSPSDNLDGAVVRMAQDTLVFLQRICAMARASAPGRIATEWLASLAPLPQIGEPRKEDARLWTTNEHSLWDRLSESWRDRPPEEVWVISPFFDPDNQLLQRLQALVPQAAVSFVAQSGTSRLDAVGASKIAPHLELFDLQGDAHRRLHAKAVAWRSDDRWSLLVGSANWTRAAFDGANAEAVLYLPDCADWHSRLFDDGLELRLIAPSEFEVGSFEAPEDEPAPSGHGLRLRSAELADRTLFTLEIDWPKDIDVEDAALDIWAGHDLDPRASVPVDSKGKIATAKTPESLEVGTGVRVALRVETSTGVLITPMVWVIRREQLEREIGEGGTSGKQRQIHDTGEGLEAYLDELANTSGPSAVAEYLWSLSLRFDSGDGRPGGNAGVFRVKVHDPFTGEGAPEWWMQLSDEAEDLRAALKDFVERHQKRRLLKHAKQGNINSLENFLDILSCLVRLVHRYHNRDHKLVSRGMVIDRFCDFAELATSGIEAKGAVGPGYLDTLAKNLRSDKQRLVSRCQEREFAECIRAVLWLAQIVRAKNEQPQHVNPRTMLGAWVGRVTATLSKAGLGEIDDAGIERGLRRLGFSEAEVAEVTPIESYIKEDHHV